MKNRMIIALCICLAVSVTACSQRGDEKELVQSQSQSINENLPTPSEQESQNELPVSSDVGESLEQDNTDEDDTEQPDPTLPENQAAHFYKWDHVEYKKFGDISTYQFVDLELLEYIVYTAENAGIEPETLKATMFLPICCSVDSVINYDGNFANGNIKIGGPPDGYYKLNDGETIKNNGSISFTYEYFTLHPLTGEKYTMIETQENQVGGYYQTQKFMRYISDGVGLVKTNLLQYVIDLGDNTLTFMYFYVSPKATVKDLEIYDAIANSVKIL